MERGFVRIPVGPPRVVLGHAPFAARKRWLDLEDAVLETQLDVRLTGGVHPVVEGPEEPVGIVLRISVEPPVAVGNEFLRVHAQIAIGVAHQPHIRRFRHEDAAVEHLQRSCQHQVIGEHRPLVHPAVAIRVFEDDDAADGVVFVGAADVCHEPGHLDGP